MGTTGNSSISYLKLSRKKQIANSFFCLEAICRGRGSDGQDSAGLMLLLSRSVKRKAPGWFLRKYEQCMYRHIRLSISTILYGLGVARRINPQLTATKQELTAGHQGPGPPTCPQPQTQGGYTAHKHAMK